MKQPIDVLINDCLEANRFYCIMSERHRAFSRGVRAVTSIERANDLMAESYLTQAHKLLTTNI